MYGSWCYFKKSSRFVWMTLLLISAFIVHEPAGLAERHEPREHEVVIQLSAVYGRSETRIRKSIVAIRTLFNKWILSVVDLKHSVVKSISTLRFMEAGIAWINLQFLWSLLGAYFNGGRFKGGMHFSSVGM